MSKIQVEKKYDNTELKFAMAQLRKHGVVARLNISVTESDKIEDSGKPYLISQSVRQSDYKKDGLVYLYFDSSNHSSILSIARLLDKSLLESKMMWNGSTTSCIIIQTPHKLYVNGKLVG